MCAKRSSSGVRGSPRLLWLPAVLLLCAPRPSAGAPANGHYKLNESQSKLSGVQYQGPVMWDGQKTGEESWSAEGGSFKYRRHVDHSNGEVSDFQSTWTITGLPPRQLTPGQKISISGTGTASGNRNAFDKQDATRAGVSEDGLEVAQAESGFVGWRNDNERTFDAGSRMTFEATVPDSRQDQIVIRVVAQHFYRTVGSLDLVYRYDWVDGPAKPEKPPESAAPTTGRGKPRVDIALDTMRLRPTETLMGTVRVTTGLRAGQKGSGSLAWYVYGDATGVGLPVDPARKSAAPLAVCSGAVSGDVTTPTASLSLAMEVGAFAPAEAGEYTLVVELTMDDGCMASGSAAFDVQDNPRRLFVGKIDVGVGANPACTIKWPIAVSGHDAPGAPAPVAKVSGSILGLSGEAKGVQMELPEQQVALAPARSFLQGTATWNITAPKPGQYLVCCQATVPYYGAKEQTALMPAIFHRLGETPERSMTTDENGGRVAAAEEARVRAATGGPAVTEPDVQPDANPDARPVIHVPTGSPVVSDGTLIAPAGIVLGIQNGRFVVLSVRPGGRASLAGLRTGCKLDTVDDKPLVGLSMAQVAALLTPEKGQSLLVLAYTAPDGTKKHTALLLDAP
jgi:hypothetical protein